MGILAYGYASEDFTTEARRKEKDFFPQEANVTEKEKALLSPSGPFFCCQTSFIENK